MRIVLPLDRKTVLPTGPSLGHSIEYTTGQRSNGTMVVFVDLEEDEERLQTNTLSAFKSTKLQELNILHGPSRIEGPSSASERDRNKRTDNIHADGFSAAIRCYPCVIDQLPWHSFVLYF